MDALIYPDTGSYPVDMPEPSDLVAALQQWGSTEDLADLDTQAVQQYQWLLTNVQ